MDSRVWDCESLTSSELASRRAKDAVCDAIRDAYGGSKPPAPGRDSPPDLPLFLTVYRDTATMYRDMSGPSLHKRGYRSAMHKASLNESVAAAMLLLAAWDRVALLPQVLQPGAASETTGSNSNNSSIATDNSTSSQDDSRSSNRTDNTGTGSGSDDSNNCSISDGHGSHAFPDMLGSSTASSVQDGRSKGPSTQAESMQSDSRGAESTHDESAQAESIQAEFRKVEYGSLDAGNGSGGGGVPGVVILDPMCGSGTLLIEAALLATRTAPGLFRASWPFQVSAHSDT